MWLTRAIALAVVASAIAAVTGVAAAGARTVALDKDAESVTVAGQRVSWVVEHADGTVAVRSVAPGATAPATVATVKRRYEGDSGSAALASTATGWALATRDGKGVAADPDGYTILKGERLVTGTWTGPAITTLTDCVPAADVASEDTIPLEVEATSSGFVVGGLACGPLQGLRLIGSTGVVTTLAPQMRDSFFAFSPTAAGGLLAYTLRVPGTGSKGNTDRLTVRDLASGRIATTYDPGTSSVAFGLDDDGTLALTRDLPIKNGFHFQQLLTVAPGARTPKVLAGVTLDGNVGRVVAGGGHVLYAPSTAIGGSFGLGLVPTAGGPAAVVGEPGAGPPRIPVALDRDQAAFRSRSCTGAEQLSIVSLGASPSTPAAPNGCPAIVDTTRLVLSPARHTATLPISCPNGCSGTLGLYLPLTVKGLGAYVDQRLDSSLSRTKVTIAPGATRTVTIAFPKVAQRFVAKARGVKGIFLSADSGAGLELAGTPKLSFPAKI